MPFQGVPISSAYKPRVSLRSALGYVLVALSGRTFQPYRSKDYEIRGYFSIKDFGEYGFVYNLALGFTSIIIKIMRIFKRIVEYCIRFPCGM